MSGAAFRPGAVSLSLRAGRAQAAVSRPAVSWRSPAAARRADAPGQGWVGRPPRRGGKPTLSQSERAAYTEKHKNMPISSRDSRTAMAAGAAHDRHTSHSPAAPLPTPGSVKRSRTRAHAFYEAILHSFVALLYS